MAKAYQVLVDVNVKLNVLVEVQSDDPEKVQDIAKHMAMAKFEGNFPDICKKAYIIDTEVNGITGL